MTVIVLGSFKDVLQYSMDYVANYFSSRRKIAMIGVVVLVVSAFAVIVEEASIKSSTGKDDQAMGINSRQSDNDSHYGTSERTCVMDTRSAVGSSLQEEKLRPHLPFGDVSEYVGPSESMGSNLLKLINHETTKTDSTIPTIERMLVHTGYITLQAPLVDMEALANRIVELAETKGKGYVESRGTTNDHSYTTKKRRNQRINLQLRISNLEFHSILQTIQEFAGKGMALSIKTDSNDVTDQYIDSTARADTLDISRKALQSLLMKADTVKDVLEVQRELNHLIEQMESHKRNALYLKQSANLSSLGVQILELLPTDEKEDDAFSWNPIHILIIAFRHIGKMALIVTSVTIYSFAWAIPICIVGIIVTR